MRSPSPNSLIDTGLAACVQMMTIESRYVWRGEKNIEPELLLLIKTRTALFGEAMRAIEAIHPYELPEIVATNFTAGLAGYFAWIDEVTEPRK